MKMPKQKQYKKNFGKEWLGNEFFKKWLMEVSNNLKTVYCKFFKCKINAKYSDLISHLQEKNI